MAMDLIKIKPKELSIILEKAFVQRKPIMVVGVPGIGKSEIIDQVTTKITYDMVTMYPAISDPTDFKGIPVFNRKTGRAGFEPVGTLWNLINATKPTVCLIDDLGQANMSVMAASMHLFSARHVGDHKISDFVTFVVATNDKTHHAGVSGVIEPVKSRMTSIVHLETSVEDWIEHAIKTGIRPEVIGLIRLKGMSLLSNFTPTMDLTNSPSPRGNKAASDILNLELNNPNLEMAMVQGACGRGYAIELHGFKKLFSKLADPRQIIRDPDSVEVPDQPDVIFAYCSALATIAKPEFMDSIVKFAKRLPIEFQIKLLEYDCKSADPENHSTSAYVNWAIKNQEIMTAA